MALKLTACNSNAPLRLRVVKCKIACARSFTQERIAKHTLAVKAEILSHRGHQALGWRSVSSGLLNNTLSTILFMLYSALQPVLSACVVKARIHARFIPAGCKILRTFEALCKRRGRRSWLACGIQPHRGRVHTPRGRAYTLISCHLHSTKCSVCRAWLFSHGMASHGGHSHGFQ